MTKALLLIFALVFTANSYSQNYYFKQKLISIQYTTSKGTTSSKLEKSNYGNYKMSFEISNLDGKRVPLFTEYNDGADMGYYMLVEQKRSQEVNGKIYEVNSYYSTETEGGVNVYFAIDKSSMIIIKNGRIIEYK